MLRYTVISSFRKSISRGIADVYGKQPSLFVDMANLVLERSNTLAPQPRTFGLAALTKRSRFQSQIPEQGNWTPVSRFLWQHLVGMSIRRWGPIAGGRVSGLRVIGRFRSRLIPTSGPGDGRAGMDLQPSQRSVCPAAASRPLTPPWSASILPYPSAVGTSTTYSLLSKCIYGRPVKFI